MKIELLSQYVASSGILSQKCAILNADNDLADLDQIR